MTALRRLAYIALGLAYLQIVFGAIVRITGSGLGCGDHWPKCLGHWVPPLDRPDLIIEVTHRYLALALGLPLLGLVLLGLSRRSQPGVGGRAGVLRTSAIALGIYAAIAYLGRVTVKTELAPAFVIAHFALAIALLGALVGTILRAGGWGGASVLADRVSPGIEAAALGAGVTAFMVMLLGAATANLPGAAAACQGFPLCNGSLRAPNVAGAYHLAHRVLAVMLAAYVFGLAAVVRRRGGSRVLARAAWIAAGAIALQLAVGITLVSTSLPPALQSAHQATGAVVWIAILVLVGLAARGSRQEARAARERTAGMPALSGELSP